MAKFKVLVYKNEQDFKSDIAYASYVMAASVIEAKQMVAGSFPSAYFIKAIEA